MRAPMLSNVTILLACLLGCGADPDPSTLDASSDSDERAAVGLAPSDTEAGRPRPEEPLGEVTFDWDGARRLGAWSAQLQIFEGTTDADVAELAFSAEGEDALRFSFSAQYTAISPAEMGALVRRYVLTPESRDNLLLLELPSGAPLVASGELHISELGAGTIAGTFNAELEGTAGTRTLEGQFRGPLGISCNVLSTPPDPADPAGAATDPAGDSWTGVAATDPFCARYL